MPKRAGDGSAFPCGEAGAAHREGVVISRDPPFCAVNVME